MNTKERNELSRALRALQTGSPDASAILEALIAPPKPIKVKNSAIPSIWRSHLVHRPKSDGAKYGPAGWLADTMLTDTECAFCQREAGSEPVTVWNGAKLVHLDCARVALWANEIVAALTCGSQVIASELAEAA